MSTALSTYETHYYPYGEPWSQPQGQPWLFGGKKNKVDNNPVLNELVVIGKRQTIGDFLFGWFDDIIGEIMAFLSKIFYDDSE